MSTESSEDIFFQIKKEVLDKLDLILQKINLEIINSRCPSRLSEDFTFIQLSQFENQISTLFIYLDKLYQSLNSSLSQYNSAMGVIDSNTHYQLNEMKQANLIFQKENSQLKNKLDAIMKSNNKLIIQNNALKESLSMKEMQIKNRQKLLTNEDRVDGKNREKEKQKMQSAIRLIRKVKQQQLQHQKIMKAKLCKFKFSMLEDRVQIIGKMKEYFSRKDTHNGQNKQNINTSSASQILHKQCELSTIKENSSSQSGFGQGISTHGEQFCEKEGKHGCSDSDAYKILQQLDCILDLCKK